MSINVLPHVNASLNFLSGVLLICGFIHIRRGNIPAHRACMLSAVSCSVVFLTCYVIYHAHAGRTVFLNPTWFRPYYLAILISHTILAVAIVPLIVVTLNRALRARFDRHKRIARWTWPLWMYVSVTGVIIYLLLYHIFPQK